MQKCTMIYKYAAEMIYFSYENVRNVGHPCWQKKEEQGERLSLNFHEVDLGSREC